MHRRLGASLLALISLLLLLGSTPTVAISPEPMVAVRMQGASGAEPPPTEPERRCADGTLARSAVSAAVAPRVTTVQPGPLVAVPRLMPPRQGPQTNCLHDISLNLEITSPDGRKPEGVDAWFDEVLVNQGSLEAGFTTTQPATDRFITLKRPPSDWEVIGASCTCGGTARSDRITLASYPGPMVAVHTVPSGSCAGSVPSASTTASSASAPGAGSTVFASYPAPMIQVREAPPTDTADHRPPARAPRVTWAGRSVTISDPDGVGGTFRCAWQVELVNGELEIKTVTDPSGQEGKVTYSVDPRFQHRDARPQTVRGAGSATRSLRKGPWQVIANLPRAWELTSSTCTDQDPATPSSASDTTGSAGVDPGDRVSCTFEFHALVPREGPWRADEGPLKINCGPINDTFEPLTEQVSISLARGGDRIVGRGNGVTWRFDRDGADPRRFRGTIRQTAAGATIKFNADLTLVDSEHMQGSFRAKATIQGETCRLSRSIDMRYRGR